jgi:hypothetical protein
MCRLRFPRSLKVTSPRTVCRTLLTPAQLDRLRLSLWGRNLTNQAVPMFMSEAHNPGGCDEEIDLPPPTYELRVEYTF